MNKVTIKKLPFKLQGETIAIGSKLTINVIDVKGKEVFLDFKERTIISLFPDINTSVCDRQTQEIAKLASQNPTIKFVSLSVDKPKVLSKWCEAKGVDNIDIYSDMNLEFARATNIYISKIKKLSRGFLLIEDSIIEDMTLNKEIAEDPDFDKVARWLKNS